MATGSDLLRRLLRTRWLVRLPIHLFHLRLGWLLGGRLVLLEHTGRRSGRRREVVLETVDRPDPDRVVVCSGLGRSSQWYLNVRADPRVRVSIGRLRSAPGRAAELPPEQARVHLETYARNHPRAWRELESVMTSVTGQAPESLPVLEIVLDRAGTMAG